MPLQVLKYNPGVVKDITEYAAGKNGPFWVDSDLVRFKNGYPEKIGGWVKEQINALDTAGSITNIETTITGIARRMVFWRAVADGEDRLAVGTHNHLYIVENGALYDITPLRDETNASTTTTEALDDSETAIDLTSVTGFKTAGAILIGSEVITYTGISTLTLTGCTRGADSTTAAAHDSGATVTQILIDPITTADESTTVTITDTGHGAQTSDWVVLSGAAATGGVTAADLNSMAGYQVTVLTANTYTITVPSAATSTVSAGGGNAVVIKYLVGIAGQLGAQSSDPALGWGVGSWGESTWGTARNASSSDVSLDNSSWSLSLWGEDLIATVRNGAIYYWDTSAGTNNRAVLVSSVTGAESVPTVARVTTVSFPDRHFIVGGAQAYVAGGSGNVDDMLVRWSTQEDFTKFAPTATNTAGDQRLQIGTKIVAMVNAREETIISTDEAIYGMTFVGAPFIFSFRLLATDAGAAGLNTMIGIDGNVFWLGKRNFFQYDGIVKELPCSVQYYVFDRMQTRYIDKVVVGHNKKFKEITWFYVSTDNTAATNPENDSYVTYNYAENAWSVGTMDRTVWNDSFGARDVPFAFDPDGYLYDHETGTSANGAAMNSYIEGSPREISANGQDLYMVDKVVPDASMTSSTNLYVYMNTRKYPNAPETVKGPFTITSSTQKVSTRAKGRQIALKFQSTGTEDEWTLGDFRVNSREDGLR
ncbi:hypothetical protein OAU55_00135 [Candidatus Pelagibacter sp.]|nr:hypothetical protein [Candidatus Pelagibacter sp.]